MIHYIDPRHGWVDPAADPEPPSLGQLLLCLLTGLLLCWFLALVSCTPAKVVREVRTETIHRTDTIHQVDSFFSHQTTVVRELDSAAMAMYGIRLGKMEKAWLVDNQTLQKEIDRLRHLKSDTVVRVDSVPVPYPVIKEVKVEKSLTWLQKMKMRVAEGGLTLIAIGLAIWGVRRLW